MGEIALMMESSCLASPLYFKRRRRNRHLAMLLVMMLLAAPGAPLAVERGEAYSVSLLDLLTKPEKFEGHAVYVMGFLKFSGELRIYLTRDHAEISDRRSSIVVVDTTDDASLTRSKCASNYVDVTGEFKKFPDGMFGLIGIRKVRNRIDLEDCWVASDPDL